MAKIDSTDFPFLSQVKVGQKYGRLTVLNFARRSGKHYFWICRCDCGIVKEIRNDKLAPGRNPSCGCLRTEHTKTMAARFLTKHGMNNTPEYNAWSGMRARCYSKSNHAYKDYGGRGISVCEKWRASFEAFYHDMGPRPSSEHTLDRIDNDGDYCPSNCRWATKTEQANNRRSSKLVEYNGQRRTVAEWARDFGVPLHLMHYYLNRSNGSLGEALNQLHKAGRI